MAAPPQSPAMLPLPDRKENGAPPEASASAQAEADAMFRMLRYFSLTSFLCILVASLVLMVFFRQVAIREIVSLGERHNIALGKAALMTVRQELIDFLAATAEIDPALLPSYPMNSSLANALRELMTDTTVVRIKIYNHKGRVVFSTNPASTGRDQSDNAGWRAAMAGAVASKLVYRDSFNQFDQQTEEDNLIQTYVPVRLSNAYPVMGVFEVYVDVNAMVKDSERAQWLIVGGATLIMIALYLVLLAIVRRAERIIAAQQQEIRQRSLLLERLSADMLRGQEAEKKKIAYELHEGVAQTLSAVKLTVDEACRRVAGAGAADAGALASTAEYVRSAIDEVRSMAVHLRPSSLDDLGLIATLAWLQREFGRLHPEVDLELDLDVDEEDIPQPLKVIIYRVAEEALECAARSTKVHRVELALVARDDGAVELRIFHRGAPGVGLGPEDCSEVIKQVRQRTVLSGGRFQAAHDGTDNFLLLASWLR